MDFCDHLGRADAALHVLEKQSGMDSSQIPTGRGRYAIAWRCAMAEMCAAILLINATSPPRKKKPS